MTIFLSNDKDSEIIRGSIKKGRGTVISLMKNKNYQSLILQFFMGFFQLLQVFFRHLGELQVKCLDF